MFNSSEQSGKTCEWNVQSYTVVLKPLKRNAQVINDGPLSAETEN